MLSFKQFVLSEGGNVKIGSIAAAPFAISEKNRANVRDDAHKALSDLHDSFHKETGHNLFGEGKKALHNATAFAGSTRHLMGKEISDKDFAKHKRDVGDFDVFVPKEHKEALHKHVKEGMKLGNYTVAAKNKSSMLLKHKNGQTHQFDMIGADYEKNEPAKGEQFSHSSSWSDTEKGIKGAHHKQLLNAAGLEKHKFSITHGIRSRTDEKDPGNKNPEHVSKTLFGDKANHSEVHSFTGVAGLIKKHIPASQHQAIYDKFKESVKPFDKKYDNKPAVEHLRKTFNVKDSVNESDEETHHTSVIPLVGFSPFSHMGHAADLGAKFKTLPGKKHIGISSKSDAFTPEERKNILNRQWGDKSTTYHVTSSGGDTIAKAHASLPAKGKKVLHILVGHDRVSFAHGLKKSLEAGKIKEMEGKKFDEINVHTPEDKERSHGMSGTKMRMSASSGDLNSFHKHLGSMFSKEEAKQLMSRTKSAIASGKLGLKR